LSPGQSKFVRFCLAGTADDNCYRGAGSAAQAILDHLLEVASFGRLAINMRDDVAGLYAGKMRRPTGYHLLDDNPAVGPWSAVNADAAEVAGRVCCIGRSGCEQHYQDGKQFHAANINQRNAPVNCTGFSVMNYQARRMFCFETKQDN
jgi:hypothetical protein